MCLLVSFAKSERAALSDLLDQVGPDAQTLCAGWTTHDLAAHLWIRETDPVGAGGILARPLAGLLERRMADTKSRWPYPELVDKIRNGPARFSVFAIPGVDEGANTTEFFVHHEDVRRAGERPEPPRELGAEVEEWMWRRLKLLARAWFRRAEVGVVLERDDTPAPPQVVSAQSVPPELRPETIRARAGTPIVTVVGRPSELTLLANGRTAAPQVRFVGEPETVEALRSTDLSV